MSIFTLGRLRGLDYQRERYCNMEYLARPTRYYPAPDPAPFPQYRYSPDPFYSYASAPYSYGQQAAASLFGRPQVPPTFEYPATTPSYGYHDAPYTYGPPVYHSRYGYTYLDSYGHQYAPAAAQRADPAPQGYNGPSAPHPYEASYPSNNARHYCPSAPHPYGAEYRSHSPRHNGPYPPYPYGEEYRSPAALSARQMGTTQEISQLAYPSVDQLRRFRDSLMHLLGHRVLFYFFPATRSSENQDAQVTGLLFEPGSPDPYAVQLPGSWPMNEPRGAGNPAETNPAAAPQEMSGQQADEISNVAVASSSSTEISDQNVSQPDGLTMLDLDRIDNEFDRIDNEFDRIDNEVVDTEPIEDDMSAAGPAGESGSGSFNRIFDVPEPSYAVTSEPAALAQINNSLEFFEVHPNEQLREHLREHVLAQELDVEEPIYAESRDEDWESIYEEWHMVTDEQFEDSQYHEDFEPIGEPEPSEDLEMLERDLGSVEIQW